MFQRENCYFESLDATIVAHFIVLYFSAKIVTLYFVMSFSVDCKLTFCWLSSCPTYPRTKRSCPGAWNSRYRVEWSVPWSGWDCAEKTAEVAKMVAMRLAFIVSDTKRMTGFQRNVVLLRRPRWRPDLRVLRSHFLRYALLVLGE